MFRHVRYLLVFWLYIVMTIVFVFVDWQFMYYWSAAVIDRQWKVLDIILFE
jgi:hypothetical protein